MNISKNSCIIKIAKLILRLAKIGIKILFDRIKLNQDEFKDVKSRKIAQKFFSFLNKTFISYLKIFLEFNSKLFKMQLVTLNILVKSKEIGESEEEIYSVH